VKRIDPDAAYAALKAFLEAHEASIGANGPGAHAETRQRAFERFLDLLELGRDLIGERVASALIGREPFSQGSSWGDEAEAAARIPVTPLKDMDREEAARQRRAAARILLDFERLLPPGLPHNFATSFFLANLGDITTLLKAYRVQGTPLLSGPKAVLDIVMVLRVYWLAGYRGDELAAVLRAEGPRAREMDLNTLNKIVRKHGLRPIAQKERKNGEAAKAAGKPEITPYAADYDLEQLTLALSKWPKIDNLGRAEKFDLRHSCSRDQNSERLQWLDPQPTPKTRRATGSCLTPSRRRNA
jgi:hypothetical protein